MRIRLLIERNIHLTTDAVCPGMWDILIPLTELALGRINIKENSDVPYSV